MKREPRRSEHCLNCGRDIACENFCPSCGQENSDRIVGAGDMLRDLLDELLKFDAKLFVTLRALLTKPGYLTNEYLAGRRVRYISPVRLYFLVSAAYFLCRAFYTFELRR